MLKFNKHKHKLILNNNDYFHCNNDDNELIRD
jgi:hypothetical protein